MKIKHSDALHILGISIGNKSQEDIKNVIKHMYRLACSKYHPDRNPAGLEMMKLVNTAYEALQDVLNGSQFDASIKNEKEGAETYGDEINNAINAIINLGLNIEICGSWIWVSGDTRPHKDVLKGAGFKWAPKKAMWHFRPADYKSFSRGKWDMDKIRDVHGSLTIKPKSYQRIEERA